MVCIIKHTLKNGTIKEYNKTAYNKKYINSHKQKLSEKFPCDCGGKYTYTNKDKHDKTKRHRLFMGEKNIEIGTPGRVSTKSKKCVCGGKYTKEYSQNHKCTKRHLIYIKNQNLKNVINL